MRLRDLLITATAVAAVAGCTAAPSDPIVNEAPSTTPMSNHSTPSPATAPVGHVVGHVVVVMMENHSYADVIGNKAAPYLNALAKHAANLTGMYAITHPSQPNYVALFSGGTQGVSDDVCPQTLTGANLGSQLLAAHLSFTGYSEGLPNTGSQVCSSGRYARKHAPWTNFTNMNGTVSVPFSDFPTDYAKLPALSFVIPNLDHDMHDGTVAQGDTWLKNNIQPYLAWATTHDSQLVITWDEDDRSADNHIPTIIAGAGIHAQTVSTHVTLYSLLRYLEDRFGLSHLRNAASAPRIPLPA